MRNLIVNGDDLGLTRGINEGIFRAHSHGILTSATLMATGPEFEPAVRELAKHPRLRVGVHVCLTGRRPHFLSPAFRNHPRPFHNYRGFLREVRNRRFSWQACEDEIEAQLLRCRETGIEFTHLDSHHHIHLFPPIMEMVLKAARRHGYTRMRILREGYPMRVTLRSFPRCLVWLFSRPTVDRCSVAAVGKLSQRKITSSGLRGPASFFGTYLNHFPDMRTLEWILDSVPEGTSELMVHPGVCDAELMAISRLTVKRERILDLLTSAEASAAVEKRGIRLVTFADV